MIWLIALADAAQAMVPTIVHSTSSQSIVFVGPLAMMQPTPAVKTTNMLKRIFTRSA
jgi:hypothetical protein